MTEFNVSILGATQVKPSFIKTRSYPQTVLGLVRMTVDKYIHRKTIRPDYRLTVIYKANGEEGVIKELSDYLSSSGGAVLLFTAVNLFSIMFAFSAGGIELVFDRTPVYHLIATMLLASDTLRNFFGKFWRETVKLED